MSASPGHRKPSIPKQTPLAATDWQLWVDGSALPNPGKIAIGCRLLAPDGQVFTLSRLTGTSGCNNAAEVTALCEGLTLAACQGAQFLKVYSDSDFAVSHLTNGPQAPPPHLAPLLRQATTLLAPFASITLQWIPRHRNHDADSLARNALGLPAKTNTLHKARRR